MKKIGINSETCIEYGIVATVRRPISGMVFMMLRKAIWYSGNIALGRVFGAYSGIGIVGISQTIVRS